MVVRCKTLTLNLTLTLTLTLVLTLTGDDAKADLSQCVHGAKIVFERKFDDWKVVATVDGCDYYAYKIFSCNKGRLQLTLTQP